MSWRRAITLSLGVFYAPFLLMGLYTLVAVDCSHCRQTVWWLMPAAPGVVPAHFLRTWLDLSRGSDPLEWLAAAGLLIVLVCGLTVLSRRFPILGVIAATAVFAWNLFAAIGVLAMIRA